MATRNTYKNRINKILNENTKGLHRDSFWEPIHTALAKIREAGYGLEITGTNYKKDEAGSPCSKTWTFEIDMGSKKPFYGIATCHGAGTVSDPLSSYDISAYIS
jgi:hypothetical protein